MFKTGIIRAVRNGRRRRDPSSARGKAGAERLSAPCAGQGVRMEVQQPVDRYLDKMFAFLRENALIFYAGIGMGIYRCTHEWPLWFNASVTDVGLPPLFVGDMFFLFVDIGKVAGLVVYLVLCYALDGHRASGVLLVVPSATVVVGCAAPLSVALGFDPGEAAVIAGLTLIGAGAGMLFAQWIEFCGYLPPVKVTQILALSYIVRFLLLPVLTNEDVLASTLLVAFLAGTSFVQIAFCFSKAPAFEDRPRSAPSVRGMLAYGMLFSFVCVFAFAYGLGSSTTQLSHSTYEAGLGKVLPSVFILVLAFKLGNGFDRNILYAIALPLMTAGLIGIEFLGISLSVSQVLLSAAFSTFHLLVYTMVCSSAYQSRTSAMFPGVCVRVLALVAADIAIALLWLNPTFDNGAFATVTILATLAIGIAMFLPRLGNRRDFYQFQPDREASERKRLEGLAASKGLSQRETTVFQLLVMGKSATEISEELFISNGAVRAHCSRIYDKFGVHSRKDFDALFS